MPLVCTAAALASDAACLTGLSASQFPAIKTYLLAVKAGGSLDPDTLAGLAACFKGLKPKQQEAAQTYLLSIEAGVTPTDEVLAPLGACYGGMNSQQAQAVQIYLLALWAGVDPNPDTLAAAAACFTFTPPQHEAVQTYLLCVIVSEVTCTANGLAAVSACLTGMNPPQQAGIQIALLCEINGGNACGTPSSTILISGNAGYSGNYTQLTPTTWEQSVSPDFGLQLVAGTWQIYDLLTLDIWFTTSEALFPCSWTVNPGVGTPPAPTGQYV